MAFKDIERSLYDGRVELTYKDKSHRYFAKLDGKQVYPKGVTTLIKDTIEKNGLMTWPLNLCVKELFGFYDFEVNGVPKLGFSQGKGVLWENGRLKGLTQEEALDIIKSANDLWKKRQKSGADIGTLVHEAAEKYTSGKEVEITVDSYRELTIEKEGVEAINDEWEEKAPEEVKLANVAFDSFKEYWDSIDAKVILSEEIVYSIHWNVAGTFDLYMDQPGRGLVLADIKTTNASVKSGAPMGVYYENFIQLGIYADILVEMGYPVPQDLSVISVRKDGGFDTVYASDIGMTVDDCRSYGSMIINAYRMKDKAVKGLAELYKRKLEI